ncbi:restriction endonuclease subunit S [Pseudoalteromonas sp. APC 3355]|uniref:restriction endonuclease subunit S n=1 Tax=Pseudoalteromonas sp. APC 3355 TaxID=3035199 RepID=UPI0025B2B3B7|nr:restriction endonuclease subunit S [Pseudoalteromonas sp. APC 3355]MDN3476542.1 restriction endonuclease subunit S [Pseudoalteromonas sp. APC 3355]
MAEQVVIESPIGWEVVKFTDLLDVQGGTQPPKKEFLSEPKEGYIRLLQIRDFGKRPVPTFVPITTKLRTCTESDVLIGRYGASIGRICSGMNGAYNVALAKVVKPDLIDPSYLKYFLNSQKFQAPLNLLSRSAQNGFNKQDLSKFDFLVPPLPEQKRIVEKLDSLLAQVDTIQQRLNNLPDIIKRFRQSVLAAAVSGKLTEQWRGDNKELSQWENVTLSNITRSISDGDHQAPPKAENGIPFLVISNVRTGNVNFDNVSRWVPESYYDSLKEIRVPKVDDILYTVTGSFGIPVLVKTDEKFCFQRHIAIIKPNKDYTSSEFLYYLLNSDFALRQAEEKATGTAQKTVSLKSLRGFQFNIPQIEEQTEIVRIVEHYFALADTLEKNLANAKQRVDDLTQSILAKAFRGELVPQDPNDEPADKLLARIKAARLEAEKLEKAAKKAAKASKK